MCLNYGDTMYMEWRDLKKKSLGNLNMTENAIKQECLIRFGNWENEWAKYLICNKADVIPFVNMPDNRL